jgi:hypothetical protein
MREIKFRAWDKKDKVMLYDGSKFVFCNQVGSSRFYLSGLPGYSKDVERLGNCAITNQGFFYVSQQEGNTDELCFYYKGDRLIIQQFTGLLDKNGKEIYEGDIVKYDLAVTDFPKLSVSQIVFDDGKFKLSKYSADGYMWSKMEILGNIYENIELLNRKE